jgi:uncharacterized protein with GYD domain
LITEFVGEKVMALYLYQATYTSESWSGLTQNPRNLMDRVGPLARELGGELKHVWYAFGESDVIGIVDMPNNEAAAAFAIAIASAGTVSNSRTTPLMTLEEGSQALRKAASARGRYTPPGK